MTIKKAVIAIAGKGTRMSPITSAIPKEMLPIGTTPILQMIIDEAIASGINKILFVISKGREIVTRYLCGVSEPEDYNLSSKTYKYLYNSDIDLCFAYQTEPLGTAHAVSLAKKFTAKDSFALLYGDDLFVGDKPALKGLIELSCAHDGATVVGVQKIDRIQATNYATVNCDGFDGNEGRLTEIIEKQPVDEIKSDLTSVGRYVLSKNIYTEIAKTVSHNGETWITDAINSEAQKRSVYVYLIDSVRHDTGSPKGYIHAFKTLC